MQIIYEPKLSERTTLRLGGKARAEIRLTETLDEDALTKKIAALDADVFILGGGSNLLVCDEDINLTLLRPLFKDAPRIIKRQGEKVWVRVGSGLRLPRLLGMCAKEGLSGLEGLSGIPGTVGGAIAMNAGSFGHETCAAIASLKIYSPSTGVVELTPDDFSYGYRKFTVELLPKINSWFFIIEATFILTQSHMDGIKKRMNLDFLAKKSRQPIRAWSAGCVFKNPSPETPAGMLLDKCGFKGKSLGGMAFSSLHANFLINEGKGSATAALELIEEAKQKVKERFALELETEVKIVCP